MSDKTTIVSTKEKANFTTKVDNTLDREGIVKITSVQLKKALKQRKVELEEKISDADCAITLLCKENRTAVDEHVQKEFGDKLDSLTNLYKQESKQMTDLFQETTKTIVAKAETIFTDEYNLLSQLRPQLPSFIVPTPSINHHPEGTDIVVDIKFMGLKLTEKTPFPKESLDLQKKVRKAQKGLDELRAELKKVNYKLNNFEDTKEEIEAELAKVDLGATERGSKYLNVLEKFGQAELKGITG